MGSVPEVEGVDGWVVYLRLRVWMGGVPEVEGVDVSMQMCLGEKYGCGCGFFEVRSSRVCTSAWCT